MGANIGAIYGYCQWPQIAYPFADNQAMDVMQIVSANLGQWMQDREDCSTLKKLAAKSGVGYGTVRRARNGDGNTTVENLEAIAAAFKRSLIDLISPPKPYDTTPSVTLLRTKEDPIVPPLIAELIAVASNINDDGLQRLIGHAEQIRDRFPRFTKAKREN